MRKRVLGLAAALLLVASASEVLVGQTVDPSAAPGERKPGGGLTISGKQAGWRGLYPGKSKLDDVKKALGEPESSEPAADGLTRLVFGPSANLKFNSVYVDSAGLVKKIGWALYEEQFRVPPGLLWSELGEPKMLSPYSFVKQGSIYQWAGAAVWGVVDRPGNAVITMVFYDPADTPQIPIPTEAPRL